jgi:glucosamine kinase
VAQPLVLALDGGGSKTALAVAGPDGEAVLLATGAGCNPMDNPHWRESLTELLEGSDIHWSLVEQAVVGMPGWGEARDLDASVAGALSGSIPSPQEVINDVQMAHDAAFAGRPGILVLAGTGSMVWATDPTGASLRVGGWGHDIGDEGSGYWIGREALARLSRAIDGRNLAPGFAAGLMRRIGLDPGEPLPALMGWLYGLPHLRSGVAALARDVDALAREGDETACEILDGAAEHLHRHVTAARQRIPGGEALPWSTLGGVFRSQLVRDLLTRRETANALKAPLPPLGGGLWRAAKEAGWPVDRPWIDRLAASLAALTPRPATARATGRI